MQEKAKKKRTAAKLKKAAVADREDNGAMELDSEDDVPLSENVNRNKRARKTTEVRPVILIINNVLLVLKFTSVEIILRFIAIIHLL